MAFESKGAKIGTGTVRGRIKILSAPIKSEFARVNVGDIIVVKYPEAEYSAILDEFAAVIADGGNNATHLAICIRERDKLGWFGVGNATKVLKNGEMFTLNCNRSAWESFLTRMYMYGDEEEKKHAKRMLELLYRAE